MKEPKRALKVFAAAAVLTILVVGLLNLNLLNNSNHEPVVQSAPEVQPTSKAVTLSKGCQVCVTVNGLKGDCQDVVVRLEGGRYNFKNPFTDTKADYHLRRDGVALKGAVYRPIGGETESFVVVEGTPGN